MPPIVRITANARKDIQNALDWENGRKSGLGKKLLSDIETAIERLRNFPEIGSIRYDIVRTISTSVFQYLLHYIFDDSRNELIVLRILHTSRRPDWQ